MSWETDTKKNFGRFKGKADSSEHVDKELIDAAKMYWCIGTFGIMSR